MLRVWGRTNSGNVKKVVWLLEELGHPYERIDAGGAFGVVSTPEYLALNPNGLVPVLQDGDVTLWESNTILRYLAATVGDGRFYLADPVARAQAEKWMDWGHSFAMAFKDVLWGLVRTPPEKRDPDAIERARQASARLAVIADGGLAGAPWFSGADFGIADMALGPYFYNYMEVAIERPETPRLADWYRRIGERPAFVKTVAIGVS